ncbi:tetratricopeptide repeat protein [Streptomyces sp. N2-109]|uniref:Tetratricopeptide repeat protein n=1 Tax=Streptomyces gossypii TaxID=2883101 RepID=A0ABT2JWK4_9ACTN|nr:tetratricopeptide repeat protein [Streptomyces gossypii]MCT2592277.1 tetratricopeptide repeat protein [Streptomyces gossypii]
MSRTRGPWVANSVVHDSVVIVDGARGDVNISTGGRSLYRVDDFPRAPSPLTVEQARAQPAGLLQAGHQLVPFTGRAAELEQLAQWRDGPERQSVLLVHGVGGQGKTRLAARFAAASRREGWRVLQARYIGDPAPVPTEAAAGTAAAPAAGTAPDTAADGSQGRAAGVLMVVDYAERWPHNHLTEMLTDACKQGSRTRVLLIARPSGAWWHVRAHGLERLGLTASALPLPPLTRDPDTTVEQLFTAARDRFARALDAPGSGGVAVPPAVLAGEGGFRQVLAVHMAALAAVDQHRRSAGQSAAPARLDTPADISAYLLNREWGYWHLLHENERIPTSKDFMARAVYTAALCGALPYQEGRAALAAIDPDSPQGTDQLLIDHAVLYPSADAHAGTVLEPLYPDLLAEDFLALTAPGHALDHPVDPWAVEAPRRLLDPSATAAAQEGPVPVWTRPALTTLIAAATRWPHLARGQLASLLTRHPALMRHAGGAALTALAEVPELPVSVLDAVESCLPEGRHTELDSGVAAVTARLTEHHLATTTDPAERATRLHTCAVRHWYAGMYEQGLKTVQQLVEQCHRVVEEHLDARGHRASSASDLGFHVVAVGPDDSVVNVGRPVPAVHQGNLASALSLLSTYLTEAGSADEALDAAEHAWVIYRWMVDAGRSAYEPDLARTLMVLGALEGTAERRSAVADANEQAVAIYRQLAAREPAVYEPELAVALSNLGAREAEKGRYEEALAADFAAVKIQRGWVETAPEVYEPDFAVSLSHLAAGLSRIEQWGEALATLEQAVQIYRRLAERNLLVFGPDLAASLSRVSIHLLRAGRRQESLAAGREEVDVLRRLAEREPAAREPAFADALSALTARLWDQGGAPEAVAVAREAVRVWQGLTAGDRAAHEPRLAGALSDLGICLSRTQRTEALAVTEQAAGIFRKLAKEDPGIHESGLAQCLLNLSERLWARGRTQEAVTAAEAAVDIYRRLEQYDPAAFGAELAEAVELCAGMLTGLGRAEEAAAVRRQGGDAGQ